MSVGLIFLMALAAVVATLITLSRFVGIRLILRHAKVVDIVFTVVVCFALAGTITGLLIGIVAGLVMTGILTVLGWFMNRADDLRAIKAKPVPEAHDWCPGGTPTTL